jgi:RNA polymerase sigma factor (sigma-70 family)
MKGQPATEGAGHAEPGEVLLQAVRKLRSGDEVEDGFRVIEKQLGRRLLGYFQAHSFSPEDSQDLVQKTLVRVYLGIRQLESEERFMSWLFVIARNVRCTAIGQHQRERRLVAGGVELAEGCADPRPLDSMHESQLEEGRLIAVNAAIDDLPSQQRQCLLLRVRDELSYEEIAQTLRLSVNTVRNHLAAAKKRLRHEFGSQDGEALG